jgi:hypothetical protein
LNDRFIVLAPGKATLPITVTVSIPVAHPSASTNFRENPFDSLQRVMRVLVQMCKLSTSDSVLC